MAAPIQDEDIQDEFSMFSVDMDDENILDKVKDLCLIFSKDAAGIVEEWIAFASSNGIATCAVTLDNLNRFERYVDKKLANKGTPRTPSVTGTSKFRSLNIHNDETDILDTYSPAGKGSKRQLTPDNSSAKRNSNFTRSPATPSPASFSPANAKPSESYKLRTNKDQCVAQYNVHDGVVWKQQKPGDVSVSLNPSSLCKSYKYMFQKNHDKIDVLDEMIEDAAEVFKKELKIDEFAHVTLPAQEEVTVVGRIACDSNGKMNAKSTVIEGSRENCGGRTTAVDLSDLKQYSLFPGQIVAMKGVNASGSKFVVKAIHDGAIPPCADLGQVGKSLKILVACGPYSTSESLAYEPLSDLIKVIVNQCPDVCIMMGPFIDENNKTLGTLVDQTYDELFKKLIEDIVDATKDMSSMKLVFAPSSSDVHHSFVFPQPPYSLPVVDQRVMFVPDPCSIHINNVLLSLTTTDPVFHIFQHGLSVGLADRIGHCVSHLLKQRNFYPLYPPGDDVNLDFENWITYAKLPVVSTDQPSQETDRKSSVSDDKTEKKDTKSMNPEQSVTPNILILPSQLKQFAKGVSGCCCINPGSLAKGKSGGTYAQIVVNPGENGHFSLENVSAKIVRI